jgi:hypothetical protein
MSLKALISNAAVPKFTRSRAAEDAGYRNASARQHCALPRSRQKNSTGGLKRQSANGTALAVAGKDSRRRPVVDMFTESNMETRMAVFRIDLLYRLDEHREQRHDLYAPDIAAAVVQAKALFRALTPGRPSLVGFRIMENGLIAYEASKGYLAETDGEERTVQPTATMRARLVSEPDR